MRKTVIILAVVLVVLVAAGAGGVFYIGKEAESRFDAALERFASPPVLALKKVRYEHKLLGAEAETSLEINAGSQKIAVPLRHTIAYAPFASGIAEVHTEVEVPPSFKPLVDAVFRGAAPLTADTVIRFDGGEETRFQSPSFTFKDPNGTANWQGVTGTMEVQGPHVVLTATAPGLKLDSPMGNLVLQGLTLGGDMTKAADEMWLGSSSLQMAKLEVTAPLMPAVTGEGLRLSSETAEQGPGLLRSRLALDLKKVSAQGLAFSNIGYELEFSNLDRSLLLKWSKVVQDYRAKGGEPGGELSGLMKDLPVFLKRSPKASIKRFGAVTPWGDFKGSASVTFDGKGELPPQPLLWLTRIGAEGKFDSSATLLTWLLEQQLKARAELIANAGKERMASGSAEQLAQKLAQVRLTRLEQTGALVRSGERYTAEFKMVDGAPTVNGKQLQEIAALLE